MDPAEGRQIATRAMLPHWKGFCVDDVAGGNMTAWEAVQQVQNVGNCMTKSTTKGYYSHVYVPHGYDFGKVRQSVINTSGIWYHVIDPGCLLQMLLESNSNSNYFFS